jgi:DNA mismatch repair protein MutS
VRAELSEVLQLMGTVDAMLSIGIASKELGWSYPTFSDRLQIRGLWHPLIHGTGVRNDFAMGEPVRVCFVSGPNMSGKTTLLKAVGIATLLAQIGSGVPAESMSFEPFDALLSSIDITDNLGRGESFYLAEVRRLAGLANLVRAHPRTLALVDEPFRGTNTQDAIEGTTEIVSGLLSLPSALVVVASHLSQVMLAFEGHAGIHALHFAASVVAGEIAFDYEARPGVSTQRLGMMLLRKENVLELLKAAEAAPRDI